MLQVLVQDSISFDSDAGACRMIPGRIHLEAALASRMHRLLNLIEASSTVLHQDSPCASVLAHMATMQQGWILRYPVVQVGGTFFGIDGTLLYRDSKFILSRGHINWFSIKLAAGQFLSLLCHIELIIRLIHLEAQLHVCKLGHL